MTSNRPHRLFAYGTLRLEQVQTRLFGRQVPTTADALAGWRIEEIEIDDPQVVAVSGRSRHPVLVRSANPSDRIEGAVLALNAAELAAADAYEASSYVRTTARSDAGEQVDVYVLAESGPVAAQKPSRGQNSELGGS
jgi:gamma-glutamylcyclotransferase (GGCT)/AIG2-like uncharacterized protein YtfP